MDPLGFKLLVSIVQWVPPPPMITKFTPGHDAQLLSTPGRQKGSSVNVIFLEFNTAMNCDAVAAAISLNMGSSGKGAAPLIENVKCDVTKGQTGRLPSAPVSA